ncbi:MAG: phosphotyrosine protein phosphatase [Nanoarchaeota archaeon]
MKILFVCNRNLHRSKTAEELFKDRFETKSAGLYAQHPVTEQQLKWADVIMVMEEEQRHELSKRFPKVYLQKRIFNLDVPDIYNFQDPKLVLSLKSKVEEYSDLF